MPRTINKAAIDTYSIPWQLDCKMIMGRLEFTVGKGMSSVRTGLDL